MRSRPLTRAAATVAALSLLLTACGGDDDSTVDDGGSGDDEASEGTGDDDEAAAGGADLDLVEEGTLTVCSDVPYPPFEDVDEESPSGYGGFDIDLVQEIADRLELELQVTEAGFDGIESGAVLAANQCDLAASAMTITEERAENLNFSDPYYDASQSLIVLEDADVSSLEDLAGQALGVQQATTGQDYAEENAPEDTEIIGFESGPDVFTAMQADQVQAGLQDLPLNVEQVQQDESFEIVEEYDTGEQYGFAAAPEDDALIEAVNEQLDAIREDGTYDEIYGSYFEVE